MFDILEYPHPALTVDVVLFTILDEDLKVLLVQRNEEPFRLMWSLPGGFVHLNESLQAAALRKLKEKTNVDSLYLEQLFTFGELERDPRAHVVTVAYFALVSSAGFELKPSEAVQEVKWHSVYQLPDLAFDHLEIIQMAFERLRSKLGYTTVGFQLLPEKFTLPELCRLYEVILNKKIDKRNFRKKIGVLGILEETNETTQAFSKKPAKLYRFVKDEHMDLTNNTKTQINAKVARPFARPKED